MQKTTPFLILLGLLIVGCAAAQTPASTVPTVRELVTFADISVRLDPDARRIVQQDVNALVANRQYWTAKLDRVALYFPIIEAILIDEDVPTDFKYLAVQESSLTPDAVSASTAVGYWQFKRETATGHGLRVDDEIDERKSITASTRGAAKYLKKSNAQFNNWVASLYSYYLGAGGIAKLIPPDWSYAREIALDGRTDRYILRFFAHKIAIEHALQTHQAGNRFALIEYPHGGGKSMRTIADELGVDEFELRKYNRWVLGEAVPTDRAYIMAVPVANNQINDVRQKIVNVAAKKTPDFVQNDVGFPVLRRVTAGLSSKNDPVLYEINGLPGIQAQAGDNAASLARKAKISLSSFLRYNDMSERDLIIVNDVYYLAKKRKKALVPFHNAREGETTRSISQRYGIRLKKLMRYNRLDRAQKLATGRVMWLRERRPASKPVEIINAPTPPVYDQTPSPTIAQSGPIGRSPNGPNRPVDGLANVPRNASERKVYQPKLVDGGVTPNDGTSEPATRTEPTRPSIQSNPTPPPATRPAPTTTSRSTATEDGSQRVVIVRTPNAPGLPDREPIRTVPVATTPEMAEATANPVASTPKTTAPARPTATERPTRPTDIEDDDLQPVMTKSAKTPGSTAGSRPARTPAPTRPESGGYEGPREQQADGSLTIPDTKAPPRRTAPAVAKTETRPAKPAETAETDFDPDPTPVVATAPVAARPAISAASSNRSATTHVVEPGQTYYSISKRYGLTVDDLLSLNGRTTNDVLEVGQRLTVRATPGAKLVQPSRMAADDAPGQTVYHTVAKGETMFRISQRYGVTIEQIQSWNDLTDVGVKEGQKLRIVK